MTKRARRILVTTLVLLVALAVLAPAFLGPRGVTPPRPIPPATTPPPAAPAGSAATPPAKEEAAQAPDESRAEEPLETEAPVETPAAAAPAPLAGLRAVAPPGDYGPRDQPPQPLGSLDPRVAIMRVDLVRQGAGIEAVRFSDLWETAVAKRRAERYVRGLQPGEPYDTAIVDEHLRYVLQPTGPFEWWDSAGNQWRSLNVPMMAAHSVIVNGSHVGLLSAAVWTEISPGQFRTRVVDGEENPILEMTRHFTLGANYDLTLQQRLRNLSGQPLQVQWVQYGPNDLQEDLTGYIPRRRFVFGYLPDPLRQPGLVLTGDFDHERTAIVKIARRGLAAAPQDQRLLSQLWPNDTSRRRNYEMAWLSSTNRYFALTIHPSAAAIEQGQRSLTGLIEEVVVDISRRPDLRDVDVPIFTYAYSPVASIAPGQEAAFDLGVYAGPQDRAVLDQPPYNALEMIEVIRYSMGGCCNFLTFQWLAVLLLNFLWLLHEYMLFDWGMAIIFLVIVVRTLLHPLTKKSQINMQRFGKQMAAMKPELDKLKKKYESDPKRLQVENMKLMREHGLNPFQMLGCLPMFLQMPIWIALWAMLYLAFEIRHQPAFYGVFQMFGNWQFLGDLSIPDQFLMLPGGGFYIPFTGILIDSLNILPLLLGFVFFFQQKYMSPPPTPNMTPEQIQQQRIMKVMMVVLFPLFLYKAPSGLTLYIITSSCIGIMESKYVRKHIEQMDFSKPPGEGGTAAPLKKPPKKPKDPLARMWAEKLDAARAKRQAEPPKSFKKRK